MLPPTTQPATPPTPPPTTRDAAGDTNTDDVDDDDDSSTCSSNIPVDLNADSDFVKEYSTPGLQARRFPTLFPTGAGDCTKKDRRAFVSMADSNSNLIQYCLWQFLLGGLDLNERRKACARASIKSRYYACDTRNQGGPYG